MREVVGGVVLEGRPFLYCFGKEEDVLLNGKPIEGS